LAIHITVYNKSALSLKIQKYRQSFQYRNNHKSQNNLNESFQSPLIFLNPNIINTRIALLHQTILIKLPILITISSIPLIIIIKIFVLKTYSYPIIIKTPQLFLQFVSILFSPFLLQKIYDLGSTMQKYISITPFTICCISQSHLLWILSVPSILSSLHLLPSCLSIKGRNRISLLLHYKLLKNNKGSNHITSHRLNCQAKLIYQLMKFSHRWWRIFQLHCVQLDPNFMALFEMRHHTYYHKQHRHELNMKLSTDYLLLFDGKNSYNWGKDFYSFQYLPVSLNYIRIELSPMLHLSSRWCREYEKLHRNRILN